MMRKYHRWLGIVAALFLLMIAATGLGLHIDQTIGTGRFAYGPEIPTHSVRKPAELPLPAAMQTEFNKALPQLERLYPGARILELHVTNDGRQRDGYVLLNTASRTSEKPLRVDFSTGAPLPEPPQYGGRWHVILQEIHAGRQFGWIGTIVSILSGLALLFLSGSGIWLYSDMYRKRRKANRRELFWKK